MVSSNDLGCLAQLRLRQPCVGQKSHCVADECKASLSCIFADMNVLRRVIAKEDLHPEASLPYDRWHQNNLSS